MKQCNIIVYALFATCKARLCSRMNFVNELLWKLPNDLKLGIIKNQEIPEKSGSWLEAEHSVKSPLQK